MAECDSFSSCDLYRFPVVEELAQLRPRCVILYGLIFYLGSVCLLHKEIKASDNVPRRNLFEM